MMRRLLDTIAPDYCCGCGLVGSVLCQSCKYDIVSERFGRCIVCLRPTERADRCATCKVPYSQAWVAGWRRDSLEKLVDISKFDSNRRACQLQAELLDAVLPQLPDQTVVVAVPTIRPHLRQRGFDHAEVIARRLAKLRRTPYRAVIRRLDHSVQQQSTRRQRLQQAKSAYAVDTALDGQTTYLLVDDVYTTGATARYATQALRQAGARNIWLAVTSRQPID